jgi:hypothetical protein
LVEPKDFSAKFYVSDTYGNAIFYEARQDLEVVSDDISGGDGIIYDPESTNLGRWSL